MFQSVGRESLAEIEGYLLAHKRENILLLNDLLRRDETDPIDELTLRGYRRAGVIVAVQGLYRYGRWMPHCQDETLLPTLLQDALAHSVRWLMGVRSVVDPLWEQLPARGYHLDYDEPGHLCFVEPGTFHDWPDPNVRRAEKRDIRAVADLRFAFDQEYFGVPAPLISRAWCLRIAEQYVRTGAVVAETAGQVVAMAATEAAAVGLAQVGAVYTSPRYRGRGFAKAVVAALCMGHLRTCEAVALVVREDNLPAWRAYERLGFRRERPYRMLRFR